jgi:hypothetical protein
VQSDISTAFGALKPKRKFVSIEAETRAWKKPWQRNLHGGESIFLKRIRHPELVDG